MSSTVTLSQDIASSSPGINLKWVYSNLTTIKEISLIYFKNGAGAVIAYADVPSGLLKYNLSPSAFQSGQSYSFQLQVTDINGVVAYSNTLPLTAPFVLSAPDISGITGFDSALLIQLAPTTNQISASDTSVEFVLIRQDNTCFWIVKPYAPSGAYSLTSSDSASLVNNTTYRVACQFQPLPNNTRYSSPSPLSPTVDGTPSNTPNAPTGLVTASIGTTNLDLAFSWTRPSDFSEWSANGFQIHLRLTDQYGQVSGQVTLSSDVTNYVWYDLSRGAEYRAYIYYSNSFGDGPEVTSGYQHFRSVPDAPIFVSAVDDDQSTVLSWVAPAYDGQDPITNYKVYRGGLLIATLSNSTYSYTATGLTNGNTYSFAIVAVNAIGMSIASESLQSAPFGQMAIVSAVSSGKTITVVLSPNGRPIQNVVMVAWDSDPNDITDGEFVAVIPQQQIPQLANQNVTVIKTFSGFSSAVENFVVIAHNDTNSTFYKSV
ncbi:MAG: fibronectin type III domain-containing protein [Flavobacterium sp.]|nr:MAG: fibronectin type III domain-containing protein [Flavobacterium sp.]